MWESLFSLQWVKPYYIPKKVREKSRECHNHKPQPFPDPKRKRKPTNLNKHKPNKRTKSTKISSLFPKRGSPNLAVMNHVIKSFLCIFKAFLREHRAICRSTVPPRGYRHKQSTDTVVRQLLVQVSDYFLTFGVSDKHSVWYLLHTLGI